MVKRIFKILGICIALVVVVGGASVGIYALSGGFKDNTVLIEKLYFGDDETNTSKTVYTLNEISEVINFYPKNATNKTIEIDYANDVTDEVGILKDPPKSITVGEPFTLKFNKDDKGNNVGGVASITFKSGIARVTLKVVLDVVIPDNVIYFAGNNDKINTDGRSFTMAISSNPQYLYLKSELVNAFKLQSGDNNLKSTSISYNYYDLEGQLITNKSFKLDEEYIDRTYDAVTNRYNYYYKIPVTPEHAGTIDIVAKMHRTSEIEEEYTERDFDNIETYLRTASDIEKHLKIMEYNDFINKYIDYFDNSSSSYEFFRTYLDTAGMVKLNTESDVIESKKYIYLTCEASVNITAVNLTDLKANVDYVNYNVFDTVKLSRGNVSGLDIYDITDLFGLEVSISNNEVANSEVEKKNIFKSLSMTPYLYLNLETYDADKDGAGIWSNYEKIPVYDFDGNRPVTDSSNGLSAIGYLLDLTSNINSNDSEYISLNYKSDGEYWLTSFNVPLPQVQQEFSELQKTLYLGFSVEGVKFDDYGTPTPIVKTAYSQIFINYTAYEHKEYGTSKLILEDLNPMTINSDLNNIGSYSQGTQKIATTIVDGYGNDIYDNYEDYEYKKTLYFVEKESNQIENSKKVVSVGTYTFKYFKDGAIAEGLVGERIPTSNASGYYLRAINASEEPVKVFAVVYLTDKNGNPIDENGKRILLNEEDDGIENSLVVIAISDVINMPTVQIDSFVENFNYYTNNMQQQVVLTTEDLGDEELVFESGILKRNLITSYSVGGDAETPGTPLEGMNLIKVEDFLKVKIIKGLTISFYITNFNMAEQSGTLISDSPATQASIIDSDDDDDYISCDITYYDVKGNLKSITDTFNKATLTNKRIAINNMCNTAGDFKDNFAISGIGNSGDNQVVFDVIRDENENVVLIKCDITIYNNDLSSRISLTPSQNVIHSNLVTRDVNSVPCKLVELEIGNVKLNDDVMKDLNNKKIYASYKSNPTRSGELQFTVKSYDGTNMVTTDINTYMQSISMNNKIISTNLDVSKDPSYVSQNVDCSQNDATLIGDFESNSTSPAYSRLTYSNPDIIAELQQDLTFSNGGSGSILYVSHEQFNIDGNSVTLDNKQYELDVEGDLKTLTLEKGSYYPVITKNSKHYALILGVEFEVSLHESGAKSILSYVTGTSYGATCKIEYGKVLDGEVNPIDPSRYIKPDQSNSVITLGDALTGLNSTINFQMGEEIKEFREDANGNYKKDNKGRYILLNSSELKNYEGTRYSASPIYVEDPDGDYIFNGTNYEVKYGAEAEGETRYSKKGVKLYIVITHNVINDSNGGYKYTFNETLTFEVVQEDIEVYGLNDDSRVNSESNPQKLIAGAVGTINISGSSKTINIRNIGIESKFFEHVTFKLDPTANYINFELGDGSKTKEYTFESGDQKLLLAIDNLSVEKTPIITMYYKFKDESTLRSAVYYLKIEPNFVLDVHENKTSEVALEVVNETKTYYKIELNNGVSPTIFNPMTDNCLIKNYFNYGIRTEIGGALTSAAITEVRLNITEGQHLATINGSGQLVITEDVYEIYNNGSRTSDNRILCDITLVTADSQVKYQYGLMIDITPKYTIDVTALFSSTPAIHSNTDLFMNYIKLYNGRDMTSMVTNLTEYTNLFKTGNIIECNSSWVELGADSRQLVFNNGIVSLKNQVPSEDTIHYIKFKYKNGTEDKYIQATIVIKGILAYFSETGEFDGGKLYRDINVNDFIELTPDDPSNKDKSVTLDTDLLLADYYGFYEATDKTSVNVVAIKNGGSDVLDTLTESGTYSIYYAIYDAKNSTYVIIGDTGTDLIFTKSA